MFAAGNDEGIEVGRRSVAPVAGLLAITVGLLGLASASAASADPIVFPADQLTAEYGSSWSLQAPVTPAPYYGYGTYTAAVTMNGAPKGYVPQSYLTPGSTSNSSVVYVWPQTETRPLSVGAYSFDVVVTSPYGAEAIATPASQKFTITAAKLGIEARIVADSANPADAIVSARFTGDFAESLRSTAFPDAAYTPSGSWHIAITDSNGGVTDWTIDRLGTDDVMATSFVWPNAEPGQIYSVGAEFIPSGDAAKNFVITPSSAFSYTAPTTERVFASSEASEAQPLEPAKVMEFSVPIWWLVLAGVLVASLVALLVIQAVRLRRPVSGTSGREATNA